MRDDITIVTAFFDIGRGDWTPDKGLPHYLHRTTDTYFERFANMAKLDNDMVVYTTPDLVEKIYKIREGKKTQVIGFDFSNAFKNLREKIIEIQNNPDYQAKINPAQIKNPEYWSADYVLVNLLKSTFVTKSIDMVKTDLIAWLDFGYCRAPETLHGVTRWKYPFTREKVHFFNLKDWKEGTFIQDVISNNDVHITGPCIVSDKKTWPILEALVHHNLEELIKNNLMDDDQTLLLMSYLSAPDKFELHHVSSDDWFIVFRDYNEDIS